MPLPGPGEHPISDLIFHGRHPFPHSVEQLILRIHAADPRAWREFSSAAESWTRLSRSEESCGRVLDYLNRLLQELDDGEVTHH